MFSKIEKLCNEKKISIYRLSEETGIKAQIFTNCKNREGNLSAENLQKVANYFGVQMEDLMPDRKE